MPRLAQRQQAILRDEAFASFRKAAQVDLAAMIGKWKALARKAA